MIKQFISKIFIVIMLFSNQTYAAHAINLSLYEADIGEVVRLIADLLHMNVIVSENVTGKISIHFKETLPMDALDAVLIAGGLAKKKFNNIILIAPQSELQQKEKVLKQFQMAREETLPHYFHFWPLHYARAKEIAKVLNANFDNQTIIKIDERTNILYVDANRLKIKNIEKMIKTLDIPVNQILVEARIVSIDEDVEQELGLLFKGVGKTHIEEHAKSLTSHPEQYAIKLAKLANRATLDVRLSLLEREGRAELISSPSLYTSNQQSASIEAGEEVPYQETSENGGTTTVFKKAVLGLQVTPQVLPNNQVLLRLKINQDRPGSQLILGVPIISTHQMLTNVLLHNGETIVLGGIYETNKEKGNVGVPYLSHLPLIGKLFTKTSRHEKRRRLLIFVTPIIVA